MSARTAGRRRSEPEGQQGAHPADAHLATGVGAGSQQPGLQGAATPLELDEFRRCFPDVKLHEVS